MSLDNHDSEPDVGRTDDELAEVIAKLTPEEANELWSVVVQSKPDLND